jgi:hypothetical protein
MMVSKEFHHSDDYVVITVDIEDCPLVEFPLTELFDIATSRIVDNYLQVVQDYVMQLLEDTTWLDMQSTSCLLRARFSIYHRRDKGELLTLRQPALQRLISQMLRYRNGIHSCHPIEVPLFIRFLRPAITLPRKTRFPTAVPGVNRSITEAQGFVSTRSMPSNGFSACCTEAHVDTIDEATTNGSYYTMEAAPINIEDMGYHTSLSETATLLKCSIVNEGPHFGNQSQLLTFDTVQHTTVPASCPGLVESQNVALIISSSSAMTDIGTLLCYVTTPVSFWADVSCQTAIETSNRLLPSIDMRFHPIDRGRFLHCAKM